METPKVFADFQHIDDQARVFLTGHATQADLQRLGITLHDGLRLTLYDDADDLGNPTELQADAVVTMGDDGQWVAVIDWADL